MRHKSKKFYVAAPAMLEDERGWRKATLQEAVDHATELAEKTGREQLVVQVVRTVALRKPPVVVTKL